MSINISVVIWTIINFLVLMFLLNKFLYQPILRHMDARKERIQAGLQEETAAQKEVEACQIQLQQELEQQRQQAKQLLNQSKREAGQACEALYAQATADAVAMEKQAADRLVNDQKDCQAQVQEQIPAYLAVLADRMLGSDAVSREQEQQIRTFAESARSAD